MRAIETVATVEIPENVEGKLDGRTVTIKGEKGELTRDFSHAPIKIQLDGKTVIVQASWPRKKEAALVGTVRSHIQNMIKGVTTGFTFKLKVVFFSLPNNRQSCGKPLIYYKLYWGAKSAQSQDNGNHQSHGQGRRHYRAGYQP